MYRHTFWSLATLTLLLFNLSSPATLAATDAVIWWPISERTITPPGDRLIVPRVYRTFALDQVALSARLAAAPLEHSAAAGRTTVTLPLPLPDGTFGLFAIMESPIMEPGLAAQFPEIETYMGQGLDDPTAVVRFDRTPAGFHAMILSDAGTIFIDPYSRADTAHYISYFKRDYPRPAGKTLEEQIIDSSVPQHRSPALAAISGASLRTYRLAVAATGEYTAFAGGTVSFAMAAIATTINRVNVVYEREVAVRLVLIAGNAQLVYTNGGTDPYTNNDGNAMLNQNQSNLDTVIGSANYDIGHVFSTGGGGIAALGAVCIGSVKAQGVTGSPSPVGDAFDVDFVAHEIGHQFSANHTFNGTTGNCGGGNRNPSTAYEPGSGSTIMGYAGICGAEDLQPNSDAYFHGASFDEIVAFTTSGGGSSCGDLTITGNSAPTVNAGVNFTIPRNTPFTLTGSATDLNGDALTYDWEEFDLGTAAPPNTDNGSRAILRSFAPTSSPSRTVPKLSDILNNTTTFGESLLTTNRTMQFRLTARDNHSGGSGVANDSTSITISSAAGPFVITAPNTALTWVSGTQQTVTWNVANTTPAPVSCPNVTILLSTDGGATFPTTVLAGTPNDGTQAISVPNAATTSARIKVVCANNIFFDISNANFTIQAVSSATIAAGTAPAEPSTNGSFTITLSAIAPAGGLTVNY
ncbi:MAG: reprolysin-like metallopeptidase, partial [Roseiflexaceae bacterium]